MTVVDPVVGLLGVTKRILKNGARHHVHTLARFSGFIAIRDKAVTRAVERLLTATDAFVDGGSQVAHDAAWKAISDLEKRVRDVAASDRPAARFELQRQARILLAHDPELARDIEEHFALEAMTLLFRGFSRADDLPLKAEAVITSWRRGMRKAGGSTYALFRSFKKLVDLDHPAIVQASAYIRDKAASIRKSKKLAEAGSSEQWLGHVSKVQGLLGEAHALLSKDWRRRHRQAFRAAKAAAKKLGKDWQVLAVSQLENGIRLGEKEGADEMILLINRSGDRPQAVAFMVAQVKTAKVSEAFDQVLKDVTVREHAPVPVLEILVKGEPQVFELVGKPAVQAQRFILNPPGSRVPLAQREALKKLGVAVREETFGESVAMFTELATAMIKHGLDALP